MYLRRWLRPLFYGLLLWLSKAQGTLWHRGVALSESGRGLDVGCGTRKRQGFIGIDRHPSPGVDVVCELETDSLPFASSSFSIVYANHVLEHIADLEGLLVELSRVMKPGARLQIGVPYAGDLRAFQDPTHVRYFTLKTFEYFIREGARVGGWYLSKPFRRIVRRSLVFGGDPLSLLMALVVNRDLSLQDFYEGSVLRIVPARDLQVELEK